MEDYKTGLKTSPTNEAVDKCGEDEDPVVAMMRVMGMAIDARVVL